MRGLGVVLANHRDETYHGETDDEVLTLKLERARHRFENGAPSTRYRFRVLQRQELPEDPVN